MDPLEKPTHPSGCMRGASGNCPFNKQPVVPEASVKYEQDFWGHLVPRQSITTKSHGVSSAGVLTLWVLRADA